MRAIAPQQNFTSIHKKNLGFFSENKKVGATFRFFLIEIFEIHYYNSKCDRTFNFIKGFAIVMESRDF